MNHFILYVLLASGDYSQEPFPEYADCYQVQQIVGGACVEVGFNSKQSSTDIHPLVSAEQRALDAGVRPKVNNRKAMEGGYLREEKTMEGQDI